MFALLPLRDDQLQLASASNDALLSPVTTRRLLTRTAAGVRDAAAPALAAGVAPPARYLDAADAAPADAVFHGTGDEQDVRSAGWLAFLRGATVLTCGRPLPPAASPADARAGRRAAVVLPRGVRTASPGRCPRSS